MNVTDQAKTIEEIVSFVAKKGWTSAEVVAGTQTMKRLIWIETKRSGIDLTGYTPSANDEKCYDRLAKRAKDMGLVWERSLIAKTQLTKGIATAK